MSEFTPTVTISLKEYERLMIAESYGLNIPELKLLLGKILYYDLRYGKTDDWLSIKREIEKMLDQPVWNKK
jgi:hypothetical protein